MWAASLFMLTLTVYVLPLLPALQELYKKRDAQPAKISLSHDGDIRFFARNFREYIDQEINALVAHRKTMERRESYALVGEGAAFKPSDEEMRRRATQKIVAAAGKLTLPNEFNFDREVYAKGPIWGGVNNRFRAVLSEKELIFAPGGTVLRWAHAEKVVVSAKCHFFGRLSADQLIEIEAPCEFQRISAPCIRFGKSESFGHVSEQNMPAEDWGFQVQADSPSRCIVDGDLNLSANTHWFGDIVGRGNVRIGACSKIDGSIKAHGSIHLANNSQVRGALVARDAVVIHENSRVCGPIVSDRVISLYAGTTVGTGSSPSTVTAPKIKIDGDVTVFGSVWARASGNAVAAQPNLNVDEAWLR